MAFGLKFTLGGAPNTPHTLIAPEAGTTRKLITDIRPGEIVAIDDRGISLEDARAWTDDPGCPLELVQIDKNGKEIQPNEKAKD